jgi:hypothetical protein
VLVLIKTVGAAQMEVGSGNAQEGAKRVYNGGRFLKQKRKFAGSEKYRLGLNI